MTDLPEFSCKAIVLQILWCTVYVVLYRNFLLLEFYLHFCMYLQPPQSQIQYIYLKKKHIWPVPWKGYGSNKFYENNEIQGQDGTCQYIYLITPTPRKKKVSKTASLLEDEMIYLLEVKSNSTCSRNYESWLSSDSCPWSSICKLSL